MRVGVSESDPWVELRSGISEPSGGAEVELVRRFARDLGARIEWVPGSEEELVDAMKRGSLDLLTLEELAEHLLSLEWKVHDIVVVPVREIDIPSPGAEPPEGSMARRRVTA